MFSSAQEGWAARNHSPPSRPATVARLALQQRCRCCWAAEAGPWRRAAATRPPPSSQVHGCSRRLVRDRVCKTDRRRLSGQRVMSRGARFCSSCPAIEHPGLHKAATAAASHRQHTNAHKHAKQPGRKQVASKPGQEAQQQFIINSSSSITRAAQHSQPKPNLGAWLRSRALNWPLTASFVRAFRSCTARVGG